MVKKSFKRVLAGLLTATMMSPFITGATEISKTNTSGLSMEYVIEQLKNLTEDKLPTDAKATPEQLFISGESKISPRIDVKTAEQVNIIVEFNSEPTALSKNNKNAVQLVDKDHQEFNKFINTMNNTLAKSFSTQGVEEFKEATITTRYEEVFNGVAMTIAGNQVEQLLKSGNVKKIWADQIVQLDNPIINNEVVDTEEEAERLSAKQYGEMNVEPVSNEDRLGETLKHLGILDLHKEGIKGNGVKVGVIDTGVDYNHPDLRDLFYKDGKLRDNIGYDAVEEDDDPMETTYDQWKVSGKPESGPNWSKYYTSHGTHVTGTIAGQAKGIEGANVLGIAPEVEMYVYRALGPYGSGTTADILQAMELAVANEMDVVNMSLGGGANDPLDPTSVAANNATLAGVTMIIAAGNAGRPYTLGSPGAAPLAITVGSNDPKIDLRLYNTTITSGDRVENIPLKLLGRGMNNNSELLENKEFTLSMPGGDFTGKVVVLPVWSMNGVEYRLESLKGSGAETVIVYNQSDEPAYYLGEIPNIPTAFYTSGDIGKKIMQLAQSGDAKINMGPKGIYTIEGQGVSSFSSRGPVEGTQDIKPEILAPGLGIYSTYPDFMNDSDSSTTNYNIAYARISGTSMATPHIAGIAALIKSEHPDYTPEDIKIALMNSTNPAKGELSIYDEGAGIIDAKEAVGRELKVKVKDTVDNREDVMPGGPVEKIDHQTGSLRFGYKYQGSDINPSKEMTIENTSKVDKTLTAEIEFNYGNPTSNSVGAINGMANKIDINIPRTIEVPAGTTKKIDVAAIIPEGASTGLYEGYVKLIDGEDVIRVPFSVVHEKEGIRFSVGNNILHSIPLSDADQANTKIKGTISLTEEFNLMDAILLDGDTGAPLGLILRSTDIRYFKPGRSVDVSLPLNGYYKFTGNNESPLEYIKTPIADGYYKVGLVGITNTGKVYMDASDIYIDNIGPKLEVNHPSGIKELKDSDFKEVTFEGQKYLGYEITGKIYDEQIEIMKEKGFDVSQKDNMVAMFYGYSFVKNAEVDEEGNFKVVIPKEHLNSSVIEIKLEGIDRAMGPGRFSDSIVLYREGQSLHTVSFDKTDLNKNEKTMARFRIKNQEAASSVEIYIAGYENVKVYRDEVEIGQDLLDYAKERNGEVKVAVKEEEFNGTSITLSIKDKTTGNMIPIEGNFDLGGVNISLQNSSLENRYFGYTYYTAEDNEYKFKTLIKTNIPRCTDNNICTLSLDITPIGLLYGKTGNNYSNEAKRVKATIIHDDGTEVKGEWVPNVVNGGKFVFKDVDASKGLRLVAEAPGHLKFDRIVDPFRKDVDGNSIVENVNMYYALGAGDINGDDIVDMYDFLAVYNKMGLEDSTLTEDLDGNGVINNIDLGAVAGFMGTNAGNHELKPTMVIDGKTYTDYLDEVQRDGFYVGIKPHTENFNPGGFFKFDVTGLHTRMGVFYVPVTVAQYDEKGNLLEKWDHQYAMLGGQTYEALLQANDNAHTIKIFVWTSDEEGMQVVEKATIIRQAK